MFAKLLAIWLSAAPVAANEGRPTFPAPTGKVADAIALLAMAQDAAPEEALDVASKAVALVHPQSPAGEKLQHAMARHREHGSADELRASIAAVHQELSFQPLREAELPEGFPTYTPSAAIEVKRYPASRRAVADEFLTLFAHISARQIAMTAPVRMEFESADDGELKQQSMAFYYPSPKAGKAGKQGAVRAVDDVGELVVALGQRGEMNDQTLKDGEARLRRYLEANPEYDAAGELIVMGYNSPLVPNHSTFIEIQLPIRQTSRGPAEQKN